MKNIFILISSILIISCGQNKDKIKRIYSEDGTLSQQYAYYNSDTNSYLLTEYYTNGLKKADIPYVDNKIQGNAKVYYSDGKLKYVKHFENDKLHGVTKEYNQYTGQLRKEQLFLDNIQVVEAQYGKDTESDTLFGVSYFYPFRTSEDTIFYPVGSITWDKDGYLVDKMSTYYEVFAEDTITNGDTLAMNICFHFGLYTHFKIELILGNMNSNFAFESKKEVQTYFSDSMQIKLAIHEYNVGSNLLLGKIRVKDGDEDVTKILLGHPKIEEYIFYYQFEVVK